ncbi:MAG: hypothetical protein WBD47_07115, partial [Phormidesmis sp.]
MPVVDVPDTSFEKYYLIAFDKDGQERSDDPDGLMSQKVLDALSQNAITDVFLISHGWLGDVPAAKRQYDAWIGAMANSQDDIQAMKNLRPDFNPLIMGLHWPSKPFGDEALDASFSLGSSGTVNAESLVENYATEVSDTQATRDAFKDIFEAENTLQTAYQTLFREACLSDTNSHPADWEASEPFMGIPSSASLPKTTEGDVNFGEDMSFGIDGSTLTSVQNAILKIPRMASYWKMKNLARQIGQTSGFDLLTKLQKSTDETVRFHLIGHSFGTIVVSATLRGPEKTSQLVRPIDSLSLIQGAVSLWSYCSDIPERDNLTGYFYPLISEKKVNGPIITTLSKYDRAVKDMYPLASKVGLVTGKDIDFDVNFGGVNYPEVGGIGT